VVQAELPSLLKRENERSNADAGGGGAASTESRTDSVYALVARCDVSLCDARERGDVISVNTWQRRRDAAYHSVVNQHLRDGEYLPALARLDWLARQRPADTPDPVVLSLAGRTHLLLGDTEGAEMCFTACSHAVEGLCARGVHHGDDSLKLNLLCDVDAGVLAVAKKEYASARTKFAAAVAVHANELTSMSNLAVSHVYTCDMKQAIKIMEHALITKPSQSAQHEPLLRNANSAYDVSALDPASAKRVLAGYVTKFAPDDLDPKVLGG
jgi:Flp pilus assembly protein TadD